MTFENMKLKNIECAVKFTPKNDRWITENRKYHIMGIELEGVSIHDFGGRKFTLEGNSLFFFNRKDDYSVDVKERGASLSVHFTTYEDIETDTFCIKDAGTPEIINLLERLVKGSATIGENDLKLSELFYRLCFAINAAGKKNYSKKDLRMVAAKENIDRNYRERGCLEKAVESAGISRRRFNDLFKNTFGYTPNRYIVRLKIEYAKQLLSVRELSVSEISEMCGFADIYYFSKVFKAETGLSPSAYRANYDL